MDSLWVLDVTVDFKKVWDSNGELAPHVPYTKRIYFMKDKITVSRLKGVMVYPWDDTKSLLEALVSRRSHKHDYPLEEHHAKLSSAAYYPILMEILNENVS